MNRDHLLTKLRAEIELCEQIIDRMWSIASKYCNENIQDMLKDVVWYDEDIENTSIDTLRERVFESEPGQLRMYPNHAHGRRRKSKRATHNATIETSTTPLVLVKRKT